MVAKPVHADDAFQPGPIMRPIDWPTLHRASRAPWVLYLLSGVSALPILLSSSARRHIRDLPLAVVIEAGCVVFAVVIFFFVEVRPALFRRHPAPLVAASIVIAGVGTTLALASLGPSFGIAAITYPEPMIFAFALFRMRWAIGAAVLVGAELAVLFVLQDGWVGAFGQWPAVVTATVAVSVLAGQLSARTIASTAAERRARAELAEVNSGLQRRVQDQVSQLERAGQLRRFLAPQVADAVLSGDTDGVLAPHRRRVAVFFCDLRGFTAFAAQVEPEDVIDVLETYYRVVGERLRAYGATIGSLLGDGVMAYLNDPAPCADPAGTGIALARAVRADLAEEITQWRRAGYDLGCGFGLAVGHATLGVVGFEGRQEYTALGTVVNLAARLCSAARDGQILIDRRVAADVGDQVPTTVVDGVTLKGFPAEMEVLAVD